MLASTMHWQPLVNAYSDYIPPAFNERLDVLGGFPSRDALLALGGDGVRYAVIHWDALVEEQRGALRERLERFAPYLRVLYEDPEASLYELTGLPR